MSIGGSGLYQMDALEGAAPGAGDGHAVWPALRRPRHRSAQRRAGGFSGAACTRPQAVALEVPNRANIHAMKQLGVRYLLSLSAVGSLREDFLPLGHGPARPVHRPDPTARQHLLWPGAVAHVSMAQPVCPAAAGALARAVRSVLAGEGVDRTPRRCTSAAPTSASRVRSFQAGRNPDWYRSMGAGVIGMTAMPEAKLAREAQIAYMTLAMVTDYDCWHPREAHVNANMALENLFEECRSGRAHRGRDHPPSGRRKACQRSPQRAEKLLITQSDAMAPRCAAPGGPAGLIAYAITTGTAPLRHERHTAAA